ncbi:LOW QUALITY PROTEIN: uncharacterized protein LOC108103046 [Drosophila eugracilis]|uniref:LOW QUALITY PROTEIN: uncharacterized protein LOC108103046 n=1 Tax=Drosophila eugracilis TaxID=29029 RepID=UPI001BDA1896|nr:LOW QUALITY PROTEIN: uncharacterized protein LOC108103046 [Drosophila eugracilis]
MPIHNTRLVKQVNFKVFPEEKNRDVRQPNTSPRSHLNNIKHEKLTKRTKKQTENGLTSCLTTSSPDLRISGGANDPAQRDVGKLPRTDSECRFHAPGFHFLTEQDTTVNTHEVKMSPRIVMRKELKHKCDFFTKAEDNRPFKDQITQTLYRESSAQTLSYLPEILEADGAKTLELFSLPSVLPEANRPGLHEVEVLERARKRWAFRDALKVNMKRLLNEARSVAIKTGYKKILEAFEWEQWIQREEDIQECQMIRLQIVIKMFDKREKEMHAASKTRIEKACERIEARRQAGLRKNEIEFQRGMRQLEFQVTKTPRKWIKQSPMHSLGSPCSEFYAPLLRYGVDPARRNFVSQTERNAFDMRIDKLEKQVNMNQLKCPFRKLKDWSKPKQFDREYERNFCNEANLQKLFESLRTLRTQATQEKEEPKCLRKRRKQELGRAASQMSMAYLKDLYDTRTDKDSDLENPGDHDRWNKYVEEQIMEQKGIMNEQIISDKKRQDIENLLNMYEGSYIGWVMQFLSEEMNRLSELRKLHFFSIMAQKERWRREAAEAGLRQKEDNMRMVYEELFQQCNVVNNDISNEYMAKILTSDMYNAAEGEAADTVTELAKQIDQDIHRWLESFKLIQNPLNYVPLRLMLKDMVSPNMNQVLQRYENSMIVQYVVEDVLFPELWKELEPFDIGSTLTSDLIDRLIDNDLYLMSTDSESDIPQKNSWYEAHAIIRKIIRQAVPGRRWLEENERIVTETYNDLFDDVFASLFYNVDKLGLVSSKELVDLRLCASQNVIRSTDNIRDKDNIDTRNLSSIQGSAFMRKQMLNLMKKFKKDNVTRLLENLDNSPDDPPSGSDHYIGTLIINSLGDITAKPSEMFSVISTHDFSDVSDLTAFKIELNDEVISLQNNEDKNLVENETITEEGSPMVSFHKLSLQVASEMEYSLETSHSSKPIENMDELDVPNDNMKPSDLTQSEVDPETNLSPHEVKGMVPPPQKLETMVSPPHELKTLVLPGHELKPMEMKPISSGSKDVKSIDAINKEVEPPEPEVKSKEPELEHEIKIEPITEIELEVEPELETELEAELKSELEPELRPEPVPIVEKAKIFIPPVQSEIQNTMRLRSSKLEKQGTLLPAKMAKDHSIEKRRIGSLGSHFNNPLDAVIPVQTSDDHLPVNDKTIIEQASRTLSEND